MPIKIYKTTAQRWCVSDKNIKGINYHLLLPVKTDYTRLTIDSMQINDDKIVQVNYSVIGKSNTYKQYQKNDTIIISHNSINQNSVGQIIIYYTFKNKKNSLFISNIKEIKSLCP